MSRESVQNENENTATSILCLPCNRDGVEETGQHFCLECREYMCNMCCKYHKRSKPSAQHELIDVDKMPTRHRPVAPVSSEDVDVEVTCGQHNYKKFKYICLSHQKLCCSKCVIEHHRSCEDVTQLSDYIEHKDYKNQLKSNTHMIRALEENAQKLVDYDTQHVRVVKLMEKREIGEGNRRRDKLISQIQQVFSDRGKTITKTTESIVAASEQLQSDTRGAIAEIKIQQDIHERAVSGMNDAKKVVTAKSVAGCLEKVKHDLIQQYAIISNQTLVSDLDTKQLESYISKLHQIKSQKVNREVPRFLEHLSVLSSTMNVTQLNSSSPTCVRDCCLLECGTVVATDESCNTVRLFDTVQLKELPGLKCASEPWGVAQLDANKVAVSLPMTNEIIILRCQDKQLTVISTFQTPSACRGITTYNKNDETFIVWYSHTNIMLFCRSMRYKNTKEVDIKIPNRITLSHITNIIADGTVGQIYLSCSKEHALFACDFDGNIKWTVSHDIHTPMGLCIGPGGYIDVCSFGTHEILRVSTDGASVCDIVSNDELNGPVAIAYGKDKTTFVVCDHEPGNVQIKMFRFVH